MSAEERSLGRRSAERCTLASNDLIGFIRLVGRIMQP